VADSKSGMNLPSRTATVLTDLRSGISGTIQDTVRLKQEWTSVGQAIQTAGSRTSGLAKGGGPGGGLSSSKIAPDPNFGQQQQPSNNQVFSSPAQNATGGGNNGGGPTGPGFGTGGSDGNGMFRNLSEYVSQNRTGAILYGAGTALGSAHATSDMVQTQLLMQRAAANLPKDPGMSVDKSGVPIVGFGTTDIFGRLSANGKGNYTSRYEFIRNAANEMAFGGAPNDKMDAFNAMAAAQSYGVGGAANFMQRAGTNDQFGGSVMSVAAQIDAFVNAGNQLTDNDLVVITAGTQDIVYNATEYYASNMTAATAKANVATAAATLVTKVKRLTDEAKAKHVLLIAPINVARTPWGLSKGANYPSSSANYTFLEQLSVAIEGDNTTNSFGSQLSLEIGRNFPTSSSGLKVFLADLSNFFNLMTGTGAGYADRYGRTFPNPTGSINTYTAYSTSAGAILTNPDVPVCTVSILLCTNITIATNSAGPNGYWDYTTSVFADDVNLTPAANRMLADYIFNGVGMGSMRTAGWR